MSNYKTPKSFGCFIVNSDQSYSLSEETEYWKEFMLLCHITKTQYHKIKSFNQLKALYIKEFGIDWWKKYHHTYFKEWLNYLEAAYYEKNPLNETAEFDPSIDF